MSNLLGDDCEGHTIQDWHEIRKKVLKPTTVDEKVMNHLYHKVRKSPSMVYGRSLFKVIYYVTKINKSLADYMIEKYDVVPIDFNTIRSYLSYRKISHKHAYVHVHDGIYRLRKRDFGACMKNILGKKITA